MLLGLGDFAALLWPRADSLEWGTFTWSCILSLPLTPLIVDISSHPPPNHPVLPYLEDFLLFSTETSQLDPSSSRDHCTPGVLDG